MDYQLLDSIVDSHKEDIISTLKRWLRIPSVCGSRTADNAPFGEANRQILDMAIEDAKKLGFVTDDVDGYVMTAQMGTEGQTLGILCHLDVVPAGEGWTYDPWQATVDNGRIYGRGIIDDKGAAVVILYAMKAIQEAGISLKNRVRLICGCSEETGFGDMAYYIAHRDVPDFGFSPDANFPVINLEKGGLGITFSLYSEGEENAELPVYEMYAGERQNVVPPVAWAILGVKDMSAFEAKLEAVRKELGFSLKTEILENGRCRLTATGKGAHASTPELGVNAAGMLLITLSRLEAGGGCKAAIRSLAEHIGMEGHGESLGIACRDEVSGPLTCNLGLLRFNGHYLEATCDMRTPVCADHTAIIAQAAKTVSDARMSVRYNGDHAPHHVPAEHPVVQELLSAYSEVSGQEGYTVAIGGGTYAQSMDNVVAFGMCFPGDDDPCHMPDEYIDIDKMMLSARIFAHAIVKLAAEEK